MHTASDDEIRAGMLREELVEAVRELDAADATLQPYLHAGGTPPASGEDYIAMERVNRAKARCVELAKRIVDLQP